MGQTDEYYITDGRMDTTDRRINEYRTDKYNGREVRMIRHPLRYFEKLSQD